MTFKNSSFILQDEIQSNFQPPTTGLTVSLLLFTTMDTTLNGIFLIKWYSQLCLYFLIFEIFYFCTKFISNVPDFWSERSYFSDFFVFLVMQHSTKIERTLWIFVIKKWCRVAIFVQHLKEQQRQIITPQQLFQFLKENILGIF